LSDQKVILLGDFTDYKKSPLDGGYNLHSVINYLRGLTRTPILTGLPFGHGATKITFPVGQKIRLGVNGRDVLMAWGDHS
jgi:muramoyltetrapeptide carboxypeptidase